jgi:hypothetical protein
MSTFWGENFNGLYRQDQGQLIQAKVRARNSKGWGQFSRNSAGGLNAARVEKIPRPMQSPVASREESKSAIKL